jgi:hypothetical protein
MSVQELWLDFTRDPPATHLGKEEVSAQAIASIRQAPTVWQGDHTVPTKRVRCAEVQATTVGK